MVGTRVSIPQLMALFWRFRRCCLVGGSTSLEVGFEHLKTSVNSLCFLLVVHAPNNSLLCMLLKSWCFKTVIEKSLRHRVRGSSKVQERVHCEGKTDRNGKPWTVSMLALHPGNLPLFSNLSCWIAYHLSVNLPAVRSIFAYLCFHLFKLVFTVWSSGDQRRARCG